ncbi:Deoxyribonuclease I [Thiorhodococcus drewsii AZ1]|uniref:Deoxyribonuclease I n=1 Tax=Thiorhodococcus drewsii AZ1 TaxID=765913 RepID=G2DX62_9GAMM|nr:endonuclease [Thiorhodococcus drewsii]EGV33416.1 Deoxyribonuclease I [Thiorhodococcus drewsii AZ1]
MARAPKKSSKKPRSTAKPRSNSPTWLPSWLKNWLIKLRVFAIALGAIGLVSTLPQNIVEKLPENAQQAVSITVDIRTLLGDIASDTGGWLGDLLSSRTSSFSEDLVSLIQSLPLDPKRWMPQNDGTIQPDASRLPQVAGSFSSAKKLLYEKVYSDHRETFYCGCRYDDKRQIALGSCGLMGLTSSRAQRVEAEHVFPAAQFGNTRKCWRQPAAFPECVSSSGRTLSGRQCCERTDPVFEAAHNDLFNLYPADGYINGQRSNFNWGMVSGGERFGDCDIRIDASQRRVQPPQNVRGDIARTMFYMRDTYGFRLSRQDEQLYTAWNNSDPPDVWEIEREKRIRRIQEKGNTYISDYKRL